MIDALGRMFAEQLSLPNAVTNYPEVKKKEKPPKCHVHRCNRKSRVAWTFRQRKPVEGCSTREVAKLIGDEVKSAGVQQVEANEQRRDNKLATTNNLLPSSLNRCILALEKDISSRQRRVRARSRARTRARRLAFPRRRGRRRRTRRGAAPSNDRPSFRSRSRHPLALRRQNWCGPRSIAPNTARLQHCTGSTNFTRLAGSVISIWNGGYLTLSATAIRHRSDQWAREPTWCTCLLLTDCFGQIRSSLRSTSARIFSWFFSSFFFILSLSRSYRLCRNPGYICLKYTRSKQNEDICLRFPIFLSFPPPAFKYDGDILFGRKHINNCKPFDARNIEHGTKRENKIRK